MEVRFDYQVGRATRPEIVFTNLLLGFELQRSDPRYVGVNLVQPEDDPVAHIAGVLVPAGREPLAGARRPSCARRVRHGHARRAAAEQRLPRAPAGQLEGRDAVASGARDPAVRAAHTLTPRGIFSALHGAPVLW